MDSPKKVVLLIEASGGYGRGLLSGIAEYSRTAGNWQVFRDFPSKHFYLEPNFYSESEYNPNPSEKQERLKRFRKWGIDGIITRDPRTILAKGINSIIAVHLKESPSNSPMITPDNEKICQIAVDHFLERGFSEFAFCGFSSVFGSQQRERFFGEKLKARGFSLRSYAVPKSRIFRYSEDELPFLGNWLKSLPENTALLCCNDDRAQHVVEACRQENIKIPEEIAVLSIDNDELICDLSDPAISSIELDSRKAGYEAAKVLDLMMRNKKPELESIKVEPTYVVLRKSTDILALEDEDVAKALAYIRDNARSNIKVSDIIGEVHVSRRVLERRFRKLLKRSILEEIRRVRVRQLQMVLRDTNLSLNQIAANLDFSSSKQICRLFMEENNISPIQYRKMHQLKA